jgi:hypothetical protein
MPGSKNKKIRPAKKETAKSRKEFLKKIREQTRKQSRKKTSTKTMKVKGY